MLTTTDSKEKWFSVAAAVGKLGSLARNSLFLFEINKNNTDLNEDILFACESCDMPQAQNTPITVPWMNSEYKIPGPTKYQDITATYRIKEKDDIVYSSLYDWYNKIYNPKTGVMESQIGNYTTTAFLKLIGYDGTFRRQWTIYNMFPTNFGGVKLSRTDDNIQIISITFAYLYATVQGVNGETEDLAPIT